MPLSKNFSAIFLTPTFDWATTHTGSLLFRKTLTASAMVDVLPVPGGPGRQDIIQDEQSLAI